jgi:mannose-6-phosphate isomerase-like protein (cupin superfamily)
VVALAATAQDRTPQVTARLPKRTESRPIHSHPVIPEVAQQDRAQVSSLFPNGRVQASPQFLFQLLQLGLPPLPHRLSQNREGSLSGFPATMREARSRCGSLLLQRMKLFIHYTLPVYRRTENLMSSNVQYPYDTRLNILYAHLTVIDEKALSDSAPHPWYNQTLCQVNGSVVRLGVIEGEYHWHKHDQDDEFFYVVEGKLLIDMEERTVELLPRQGLVVSKGVMHRTRAPQRTVILMVENVGIVPTGDIGANQPE